MTQTDTELQQALLRLNARAWGIAFGLLLGGGLFIATVVLVMRGGENVGQHLGLLRVFFPGYSISYAGAIIGFIYAFVVGYAFGRLVGSAYNFLVRPR
ncbi:MAG: hypothetical protein IPK12_15195 [Gemmatimonadetes bacterium]|nr:hypothetical protein [Gemmatimonadota bacterium]